MQQQKLCLKWNNHTINLLSVLESFQSKDTLVDVTLSCEGRNIKAHRMVLSACSPYFQNIFLENPCQHPIVIINGMKFEDITAILNFMYKGEVNVSHEGLSSFLQAAEALKVKGLAEVCGEKRGSNSNSQEAEPSEPARPQRTDTPTKKRHRNRKRSFSDSNRSDDEGAPRKHKEINSPEVHELSGDESYTGDMSSNGQPLNSRVPQNVYSRSHQSSSNITADDMEDEYEVEPSKMLEQTLTENANNSTSSDNGLRIERIVGNAPEMESSSLQEPESPPDIKPIIEFGESSAGPSEGNMLVYNEQSQPGPSNIQDASLLHDNSHTQGKIRSRQQKTFNAKKREEGKKKIYNCSLCSFTSSEKITFIKHLTAHRACHHNIKTEKKNHIKTEEKDPSPPVVYSCYDCMYKTMSEPDIANHLLSHVNSVYECDKSKKLHAIKNCEKHPNCHENEEKGNSNDINEDPPDLTCSAFGKLQNIKKNSQVSKKTVKPNKSVIFKACKGSTVSIQGNTSDHNYVFVHKIEKQNETAISHQNSFEKNEKVENNVLCSMSSDNLDDNKDFKKQPSRVCEKTEVYYCDGCDSVFTDINTLMCHRNYHKDDPFWSAEK